jgi:hypothetical protein
MTIPYRYLTARLLRQSHSRPFGQRFPQMAPSALERNLSKCAEPQGPPARAGYWLAA